MLKHIVFWKLTEEAKSNGAKRLADELHRRFKALLNVVDGLTEIELGLDFTGGEYDLALCCTLTTHEALEGYQQHPEHLKIKETVHQNTCGRACVDFEI